MFYVFLEKVYGMIYVFLEKVCHICASEKGLYFFNVFLEKVYVMFCVSGKGFYHVLCVSGKGLCHVLCVFFMGRFMSCFMSHPLILSQIER